MKKKKKMMKTKNDDLEEEKFYLRYNYNINFILLLKQNNKSNRLI